MGTGYATFVLNAVAYAVSVPLLLRWLGTERFGAWLTLLQALTVLTLATGWLSAPMVREVAGARLLQAGDASQRRLRAIVASGSLFYAVLGAGIVGIGGLVGLITWTRATGPLSAEVAPTVLLVGVMAAVALQTGIVTSALSGHNRLDVTYTLLGAQTVFCTVGGLLAVAWTPTLWSLAAGHLSGFLLTAVVALVVGRKLVPGYLDPRSFDGALLARLVRVGSGYLGYSLAFLATQSDLFLVTAVLGPSTAAVYGIALRLFDYLLNLLRRIADSMGPTMAEADAVGDMESLTELHGWSVAAMCLAGFALTTLLLMVGPGLVGVWVGQANVAPLFAFVGLAMTVLTVAWVHANTAIPFAANKILPFVPWLALEAVLRLGLGLCALTLVGLEALPFALAVAVLASTAWNGPRVAGRCTGRGLGEVIRTHHRLLALAVVVAASWLVAAAAGGPSRWVWWVVLPGVVFIVLAAAWRSPEVRGVRARVAGRPASIVRSGSRFG